jgi:hypothetical protein
LTGRRKANRNTIQRSTSDFVEVNSNKGDNSAMPKTFSGETGDQELILGAWFWKPGTVITGTVARLFETTVGKCTALHLLRPVTIPGNNLRPPEHDTVSKDVADVAIGGLKGFQAALDRMEGLGGLQLRDIVTIECTGEKQVGQQSPMLTFAVKVTRP